MAYTTPKTWNVGEVLTAVNMNAQVRDNIVALAAHNGARYYASGVVSVPNGQSNEVTLPIDTSDFNVGGYTLTGNAIVVPATAYYLVTATAIFASSSAGARWIQIRVNSSGGSFDHYEGWGSGQAYGVSAVTGTTVALLTSGQQVLASVGQSSGSALNTAATGASQRSYLTVSKLGL